MKTPKFKKGKLDQWTCIKKEKIIFWIAGFKAKDALEDVLNSIKNKKTIGKTLCKKIINYLGENFGIVIISSKWTLAAVDYTRSYPIYWSHNYNLDELKFSSQNK